MITDILQFIADNINTLNAGFFNAFSVNCIRIDGRVLKGFGYEKEDAGISDIYGKGFYIRFTGGFDYSDTPKNRFSKTKSVRVSAPMRLCFYDFDNSPVSLFLVEQKLRNDILNIEQIGYQSDNLHLVSIDLKNSFLNNHEIIKDEFEKETFADAGISEICTLFMIDFTVVVDCLFNPCPKLC
jgi:hypothetical protein